MNCIIRGTYSIIYDNDFSKIENIITFTNNSLCNNKITSINEKIIYLSCIPENDNGTTEQMRVVRVADNCSRKMSS